jgi:hypothetical protein
MKKRERPSFRRPRHPYAAAPMRPVKPSEATAGQEARSAPRCGPYVVEWQLDDTLSQQTPDGGLGDPAKPAYTRQ